MKGKIQRQRLGKKEIISYNAVGKCVHIQHMQKQMTRYIIIINVTFCQIVRMGSIEF